jgi:hypothetical protein
MIRTMKIPRDTARLNWSPTATFVLLAFLAIGAIELAGHHMAGTVVCSSLATAYVPLRVVRGRLLAIKAGR